jgi:3-methyl-2-oxobutanoate hydroxymethyltransferase
VGANIMRSFKIPALLIGAGIDSGGQLLIVSGMLGQFHAFTLKFVKKYHNLAEVAANAMKEYVADVRDKSFPEEKDWYHMLSGELEKLQESLKVWMHCNVIPQYLLK